MAKVLSKMQKLSDSMSLVLETSLSNLIHETSAYKENALFLVQRTRNTAQAISDTLILKNQAAAHSQSHHMSNLARSTTNDSTNIRVITLLTLFYLPFLFIAVSSAPPNLCSLSNIFQRRYSE